MKSKPLIRWAGSKRKLLPTLISNVPKSFDRYIEPFCGSACLFFELNDKKGLLTDINSDLINALNEIKTNSSIREQLVSRPNTDTEYYRVRSLNPNNLNNNDRAIRFLYLNRYCFNGVYRTNSAGNFNVPRGTRTGAFPPQEVFDEAKLKLQYADLAVADYQTTLNKLKDGDFTYIDPPYSKTAKFTGEYGLGSFKSDGLSNLYQNLYTLDKKGVKFLFSYRACSDTIEELSSNFNVQRLTVKRHIAGFKNTWGEAEEILVRNYG